MAIHYPLSFNRGRYDRTLNEGRPALLSTFAADGSFIYDCCKQDTVLSAHKAYILCTLAPSDCSLCSSSLWF